VVLLHGSLELLSMLFNLFAEVALLRLGLCHFHRVLLLGFLFVLLLEAKSLLASF